MCDLHFVCLLFFHFKNKYLHVEAWLLGLGKNTSKMKLVFCHCIFNLISFSTRFCLYLILHCVSLIVSWEVWRTLSPLPKVWNEKAICLLKRSSLEQFAAHQREMFGFLIFSRWLVTQVQTQSVSSSQNDFCPKFSLAKPNHASYIFFPKYSSLI